MYFKNIIWDNRPKLSYFIPLVNADLRFSLLSFAFSGYGMLFHETLNFMQILRSQWSWRLKSNQWHVKERHFQPTAYCKGFSDLLSLKYSIIFFIFSSFKSPLKRLVSQKLLIGNKAASNHSYITMIRISGTHRWPDNHCKPFVLTHAGVTQLFPSNIGK